LEFGHIEALRLVREMRCSHALVERNYLMALQVTTIMLAVDDLARSKEFYVEGLGCKVEQDYPSFVSLNLGDGSSSLALYPREATAQDAGVSPEGSGFRGVSFHYIVASSEQVDEVLAEAAAAGGDLVKKPTSTGWGYFGYFSDPDGHLWKVASSS
jgi:catechol 2,3-dioxygenase-like lactoylglutathione lyase family enzyme